MKFIIEFDGVIADSAPAWYEAHRRAAADVGWSKLNQDTFWRLTRTQGEEANILPGAKPIKLKQYYELFHALIETDELVALAKVQANIQDSLRRLGHKGGCTFVTTSPNTAARKTWLDKASLFEPSIELGSLNSDPGERVQALRNLAGSDKRAVLVACTDAVVRAGRSAELLAVAIACGPCSKKRLHEAGADVVYADLADLAESVATGGKDLIEAGLLPEPAAQ